MLKDLIQAKKEFDVQVEKTQRSMDNFVVWMKSVNDNFLGKVGLLDNNKFKSKKQNGKSI